MSDAKSNLEKYKYNLSVQKGVRVRDEMYNVYRAYFSSMYDLYKYLKSNPEINTNVFGTDLASVTGEESFAGKPYSKAVEDLIAPYNERYGSFLSLQKDLANADLGIVDKYIKEYNMEGDGEIDYERLVTQDPNFYVSRKRTYEPNYITLYVQLAYIWSTGANQVWNRAVSISNIVTALEKAGYNVSVEAFAMSKEEDEIACVTLNLKNGDSSLDMVGFYKALCNVEFFRRLVFRVRETLPVTCDWSDGYGQTCSAEMVRDYFKLSEDDLFFDQPARMGVTGSDLYNDFKNIVHMLGIEENFDMQNAEKEFDVLVRKRII